MGLKCSSLALTHELSCTHNTTVYYMLLYHQAVESAREDTMAEMSSAPLPSLRVFVWQGCQDRAGVLTYSRRACKCCAWVASHLTVFAVLVFAVGLVVNFRRSVAPRYIRAGPLRAAAPPFAATSPGQIMSDLLDARACACVRACVAATKCAPNGTSPLPCRTPRCGVTTSTLWTHRQRVLCCSADAPRQVLAANGFVRAVLPRVLQVLARSNHNRGGWAGNGQ